MDSCITVHCISADERVSHKRLASALGLSADWKLRELVERNLSEFRRYGEVPISRGRPGPKGGRPGSVYWLNEGQCILAAVRTDAPRSPDVRHQVITAFMEYRHPPPPSVQPAPRARPAFIPADAPVTFGALLDILTEAAKRTPRSLSGPYGYDLRAVVEDTMGNPWAGPAMLRG